MRKEETPGKGCTEKRREGHTEKMGICKPRKRHREKPSPAGT